MSNYQHFNDQVTVGPQPTQSELEQLASQGFKSIINFRTEDEEDLSLTPLAEQEQAEVADLEYLHFPVSTDDMSPSKVDAFRDKFCQLPKPIFAHCKSGKRAGAMVMMHFASEQGMSGEEAIQQAQKMGFECDQPELVEFVKDYVDSHSKQCS